jgi:hypothetical protein
VSTTGGRDHGREERRPRRPRQGGHRHPDGDKDLKNEGKVDQASASVKEKVGDAADGIKGALGGDKDK